MSIPPPVRSSSHISMNGCGVVPVPVTFPVPAVGPVALKERDLNILSRSGSSTVGAVTVGTVGIHCQFPISTPTPARGPSSAPGAANKFGYKSKPAVVSINCGTPINPANTHSNTNANANSNTNTTVTAEGGGTQNHHSNTTMSPTTASSPSPSPSSSSALVPVYPSPSPSASPSILSSNLVPSSSACSVSSHSQFRTPAKAPSFSSSSSSSSIPAPQSFCSLVGFPSNSLSSSSSSASSSSTLSPAVSNRRASNLYQSCRSPNQLDIDKNQLLDSYLALRDYADAAAIIFDEGTEKEIKRCSTLKNTAGRYEYKDKIAQHEQHLKQFKKTLQLVVKKKEELVDSGNKIETKYRDELISTTHKWYDALKGSIAKENEIKKLNQKLIQMAADKDKLCADIQRSSSAAEKVSSIVNDFREQLSTCDKEISRLQSELNLRNNELEDSQAEIEDCKKVIYELAQEKQNCQMKYNKLDEEFKETASDKSRVEEELILIRDGWESEKQISMRLRNQLEQEMNQTRKLNLTVEELKQIQQNLENTNGENMETIEKTKKEKKIMDERMEEWKKEREQDQIHTENQHRAIIEKFQSESASKVSSLTAQLHSTLSELADKTAQLDSSKSLYQQSQSTIASLRSESIHHQSLFSMKSNEVSRLEHEVQLVKTQLESKTTEIQQALTQNDKSRKFLEEINSKLVKEKEMMEEKNRESEKAKYELEGSLRLVMGQLEGAQLMISKLNNQANEDKRMREEKERERKEEQVNAKLREESLKSKLDSVQSDYDQLSRETTGRIESLTNQSRSYKDQVDHLQLELATFMKNAGVDNQEQLRHLVQLSMEAETLRSQVADKGQMAMKLTETQNKLNETQKKLYEANHLRRQLFNTIQELRGNVRVMTRVRPFLSGDEDTNPVIECSNDGKRMKLNAINPSTGAIEPKVFSFDCVFGPNSKQEDVFEEVSQLVQSSLDGYHVCLFSYGQTGSGKTHSMQGSNSGDHRGIIPRSVSQVLSSASQLSSEGWQFHIEGSFLEIYNETIQDLLLSPNARESKSGLEVKRDAVTGQSIVPGLTRITINEAGQVSEMMKLAAKNRATAATKMNERSSRSHSVFTLHLNGTNAMSKTTLSGSLNLCDLAGSERLSRSGAEGERMKETQAINKSLSSLTDVFTAIGQKSNHIPFRNSKLTYYLQPCLSGDGKCLMLVNCNPCQTSAQETLCSLRFAAQVNQCELGKPKKTTKTMDETTPTDPTALTAGGSLSSSSLATPSSSSFYGSACGSVFLTPVGTSSNNSNSNPNPTSSTINSSHTGIPSRTASVIANNSFGYGNNKKTNQTTLKATQSRSKQ